MMAGLGLDLTDTATAADADSASSDLIPVSLDSYQSVCMPVSLASGCVSCFWLYLCVTRVRVSVPLHEDYSA